MIEPMAFSEEDILILKGLIAEELKDVKHACVQEGVLGGLLEVNKRMIMEVYGNGHDGLAKTVPKLEEAIKVQTTNIKQLESAISGVLKFVHETTGQNNGIKSVKDRERLLREEKIQNAIKILKGVGVIIAAMALAATLLLGYLNLKSNTNIESMEKEKTENIK